LEYANDAFYAIWGLSKDDRLEGKTLRELMRRNYARGHYGADAGDFEAVYQARIEAICRPGAHLQSEISFGEDRRVVLDARQISEGRILLSYVDISSLRRQEQALSDGRQALARLGELMAEATHAMSQGLLIVEHDVILLSNDALSAMLQIPAAWLAAGQNWVEALRQCAVRGDLGADWEAILAEWTAKVARRQPISAALHVAGERWIQMDASMSAADRWLVVFTDVTETKDREKELQRLLARSEAADRAKSEFLANMSHEIRTPMNGVLGMAELLTKTGLDARQKTFVDIIAKSGNALLTIINDILDFSKIDAGQMRLRKAAFDPVEAIEDVATLLSSQAGEKNIELLVRASPLLPPMVLGDAGRFRQILTNLVGNAVKFTEHGHVLIDIDAGQTPDGATMVTVAVADTGVGISKERLDSIFDKFSQVDSSSTRRHEGTGLGLAITAGLVDLFGGYLEVDSVIGSGSVFKVHLPLPPAVGRREQKLVPVNVSGARILVIDDNEINRQILTEQLSIWGFEGLAVADGPSGLAILDAAFDLGVPVDAIILDYHMPDMNGAEVARTLRQDSRFDAVPLIFLTSMDVAGSDREFAALGGDAHLMKPARANVLRNTVIEVVRASRQPQVAGGQIRSKTFATGDGDVPKSTGAAVTAGRSDATVDILVAEDNEVNQIVFTQILQAAGAHFLVVKNGEEAVAAYRQHMPGLIMMDVSMPVMNGLQATRAIRRIETDSGRRVPIIGVTAHAMESDRDACLEAGMDDYMSKPISPELLEAKITRWLKSFGSESSRSHR
ncbi:MAG: response regulator, partial [Rhizobium sp.]